MNVRACDNAFWPVVASKQSNASCGASGTALPITRFTFSNSCIKLDLFCKRPAVSQIKISTCLFLAALIASYITAAGSEPSLWLITSTPTRSPQTFNCSIAPALNVSPAASMTFLPSIL